MRSTLCIQASDLIIILKCRYIFTRQTSLCIIVKVYADCKNLNVFKRSLIISCEPFFFFFFFNYLALNSIVESLISKGQSKRGN